MPTSQERFEEETRELALLVQAEDPSPRRLPTRGSAPRKRLASPAGFVQAWAWWRRPGTGAARP